MINSSLVQSKDDLEINGPKPRSDTVFSLSSTTSDESADTDPESSSKLGDFVDLDGPKSNPAVAIPQFVPPKLAAPKSSNALLTGRDRSNSLCSEPSTAVTSGATTVGRNSPPKVKPLPLNGIAKNGSPSPPSSPVKGFSKSSREEVKKPLSGGAKTSDSPRTERLGLRSPLNSPKSGEGETFKRANKRIQSPGNAKIHTIANTKESSNQSFNAVNEEEKHNELEKLRMKAKATKYKNELFNANIVKRKFHLFFFF